METVVIQVKGQQDVRKLRQMSAGNGWQIRSSSDMLRWLIDNAPQDVPLTDDDIMDEIRQVRQDNLSDLRKLQDKRILNS